MIYDKSRPVTVSTKSFYIYKIGGLENGSLQYF